MDYSPPHSPNHWLKASPSRRRFGLQLGGMTLALTASSLIDGAEGASSHVALEEGEALGDGIRLSYIRGGEGPLMVFLHGFPETGFMYRSFLQEFGRDHLAVAPNLRGVLPSGQPDEVEAYAMAHLLEDLHRLLDHFDRQSCILVANDWGAYIAYVFASAYPDRVDRLVVMNCGHPALLLRDYHESPEQIAASQYERFANTEPMPYPAYIEADPLRVPASIEEEASVPYPDLGEEFFKDVVRPPATTSLVIDMPTLVIWGMEDPSQLPGLLDGLDHYIRDLTVLRIDDAGHYPMRTHYDDVVRAVRRFIS